MTVLIEPASPLAHRASALAKVNDLAHPFAIREVPFLTQLNLRGDASDPRFATAVRSALGVEPPAVANHWVQAGNTSLSWLGPTEWLVLDAPGRADALEDALRTSLQGLRHAVTDVSASRTTLEIAGAHARLLLAKGGSLDWHASAFGPGQCAQTLLAKARVLVQCVDERPAFRLFVLNSFATYLAEWLADAAAECSAARALDTDRIAARLG